MTRTRSKENLTAYKSSIEAKKKAQAKIKTLQTSIKKFNKKLKKENNDLDYLNKSKERVDKTLTENNEVLDEVECKLINLEFNKHHYSKESIGKIEKLIDDYDNLKLSLEIGVNNCIILSTQIKNDILRKKKSISLTEKILRLSNESLDLNNQLINMY